MRDLGSSRTVVIAGVGGVEGAPESLAWRQWTGPLGRGWVGVGGMRLRSGWACLLHLRSLPFLEGKTLGCPGSALLT